METIIYSQIEKGVIKMSDKNFQKSKPKSAFITNPIVEPDKKDQKSNVSMPNKQNVENAKDWVDFNEK